MGSGPPGQATSHFKKKLQVLTEKHYTKKLTEIEPSRKSAAARDVPFEIFGTPVTKCPYGAIVRPCEQLREIMLWPTSQFTRQWTTV
jgi:hypothetical protein